MLIQEYWINCILLFYTTLRENNHQTRINLITNIITLCVSICIGLYYTPFLVNNLGVAQYGILPLALIVNQYISVLTGILTHSYTRFYSVALGKNDYLDASRNISTSFVVVLFLVGSIALFSIPLINNINRLFTIPEIFINDAKSLFRFTLASFCVSLVSSTLNVTMYALNRLDLMNFLKALRSIVNFVCVILLFNYFDIRVSFVGLSGLVAETLILFISFIFFYVFKPKEVKVSFRYFDKAALSAIILMSLWVLIQQCGDTLLYRTDNIIINHFFGIDNSGRLGAISELCGYVRNGVNEIGSLFGTLILIAYSSGRLDEVQELAYGQSFVVGALSAIVAGLVSGFGLSILHTWIGNGLEDYRSWLLIKMVIVPFYAAGGVLAFVYRAWNRVKKPAIWTVIIGVVDISITLIFLNVYSGMYAIEIMLIISAIFSVLQCYVLNNICVNNLYPGNQKRSIWMGTRILIIFFASCLWGQIFDSFFKLNSLALVGIALLISGIFLLGTIYLFVFNKKERNLLLSIIR